MFTNNILAWQVNGYNVGFMVKMWRVPCHATTLLSNDAGQVVHTHCAYITKQHN